jgi:hypothetical protein
LEAVRAQDVLPLLIQYFHFEVFIAARNVIAPFISRAYGPNIDAQTETGRAFIEQVAELDERLIDEGTVKPTQLIAWLRTEPVADLRCHSHWTPEHCVRLPDAAQGPGRPSLRQLGFTIPGRKASRKTRKRKIAIYGNCHAPSLVRMLQGCPSVRQQVDLVQFEGVHAISLGDQRRFLQEAAPELDVLVHQPIREDYRESHIFGTEYVRRHIRPRAITISFPSLQFAGYHPRAAPCSTVTPDVDAFCKEQFGRPGSELFHFAQVAHSYLLGRDIEAALGAFDEGEVNDAAHAVTRTEQTLGYMKDAEQEFDIDIPMSGFISDNFAKRLLFHTRVHPGTEVLARVCRRILEILSLEVTAEEIKGIRRLDPLGSVHYPLQTYVSRALNLRFSGPVAFKSQTSSMTKAEMIEKYYVLYGMFTPEMWQELEQRFAVLDAAPSP